MISFDGKDFTKLKDEEKISFCEQLLEHTKSSRENRELEWYKNYQFSEGNHYLTYNSTTNAIEPRPPRNRGEVRMVVNKVRSSKRAIKNYQRDNNLQLTGTLNNTVRHTFCMLGALVIAS